jgi:(5-formylfuran-3-yl)methyl phosphate synthase
MAGRTGSLGAMTLMLASVGDAAEAELALAGGADIIDFADPRQAALGAVPFEAAAMAVAKIAGRRPISAAVGPPPYSPDALTAEALALARLGVGRVRLAADASAVAPLELALAPLARQVELIGVLFADREPDLDGLEKLAAIGFKGVLLDAAEKGGKRLVDHLSPPLLEAFCARCRALGLESWLAGSLQSPDVPRLLLVEPSVLGFRSALCARGRREGRLEPQRIALIRDLIPQRVASGTPEFGAGDAVDRVFVHDFAAVAEIGAYAHERGVKQPLRFNIDASVTRASAHADDMRAVFSYDIILDAIRLVLGRGHVDFIETIAEDVAAIILRHARVRDVRVRVEKLGVAPGSVGVEIERRR